VSPVAEDADKLFDDLAKARSEGMERGWLVMLSVALITTIAIIVVVSGYIFIQLF
jgi:hypothetical protein